MPSTLCLLRRLTGNAARSLFGQKTYNWLWRRNGNKGGRKIGWIYTKEAEQKPIIAQKPITAKG